MITGRLRTMLLGDDAAAAPPKKFNWNKAVDSIDPLLQNSLAATGLRTQPKNSQPLRPSAAPTPTPWLKYFGIGAIAAGGIGIVVVLLRAGRRRR